MAESAVSSRRMGLEVETSTVQLLQRVTDHLKHINLDDVLRVWHHVGQIVHYQLDHKKGVRIERLGTFTLDIKGKPIFAFQEEFLNSNRVRAPQQPTSDQLSTSVSNRLLNHSQVAVSSGDDRNLVEKIIKTVVETLYQVAQGESVALAFLPVGELFCAGKTVSMRFTTEFLDFWDKRLAKETQLAVRPQAGSRNQPTERMKMVTKALQAFTMQQQQSSGEPVRRHAVGSTPRSSVADPGSFSNLSTPRSSRSSLHDVTPSRHRRRGAGATTTASHRSSSAPAIKKPSPPQESVVDRVRRKIAERGGSSGIRGLASVLKLMDDNGDKKISKVELKYGLRNYGTDLTDKELEEVMAYFDRDRDGTINFDEFLRGMRGEMNERRRAMVDLAFDVLDATGDGHITVDDLKDAYDLSWHPGVKNGSMSREEALRDFLGQWDRREKDGIVTREEFHDYYQDVSASVDSDSYFELMIRNAWHISGGEGQAANSANLRVLVTHADGRQSIEEVKNGLGLNPKDRTAVMERLRRQGVAADSVDVLGTVDKPLDKHGQTSAGDTSPAPAAVWAARLKEKRAKEEAAKASQAAFQVVTPFDLLARLFYTPPKTLEELIKVLGCSLIDEDPQIALAALGARIQGVDPAVSRGDLQMIFKELDPRKTRYVKVRWLHKELADRYGKDRKSAKPSGVIERVQAKIRQRSGEASLKGLSRTLALFDNNGDKKISKMELKYGLEDYGVTLNQRELDDVMNFYDRDRDGTINFDEFLRGMRGEMNERRRAMVDLAFDVLDATGDGHITVDDLKDAYDLSWHPGVKNGSMSREEALRDFLGQWDRREKDGIVTREEFHDYYQDVSASVDSDSYFELMIRNAWHTSGGEGQAANSANLRVLVTHADGRQTVQEVQKSLGVKKGDVATIKTRLRNQGSDAVNVDLKGATEKPADADKDTAEVRLEAATRLQTTFRSHKARVALDAERRKVARTLQVKQELEGDTTKAKEAAQKYRRPQLKGYYGF